MSTWREGGREWGREDRVGTREEQEPKRTRKEQERGEGASSPFYSGSGLPGCCQVTVGRSIPGCCQVTVGWSLDRMLTRSPIATFVSSQTVSTIKAKRCHEFETRSSHWQVSE